MEGSGGMEEVQGVYRDRGSPPKMAGDSLKLLLEENRDVLDLLESAMDAYSGTMHDRSRAYGVADGKGVILAIFGDVENLAPLGYEKDESTGNL